MKLKTNRHTTEITNFLLQTVFSSIFKGPGFEYQWYKSRNCHYWLKKWTWKTLATKNCLNILNDFLYCLNILRDCSSMFSGSSWALILQITAQTVIFIWVFWNWKISGYPTEIAKMLNLNTQHGVFLNV